MTNIYKVGVSLVMTGNYAQVLGLLSKQLLGVNAKVKDLEGGFSRLGKAIGIAVTAFAGEKMISGMVKMVELGNELVHQQQLLAITGATQKEQAEATAQAYRVSAQVQTASVDTALRHIREMRFAFGRMPSDKVAIETEKANAIMEAIGGHDYTDQVWDLIKSNEMTNRMSDAEYLKSLNMMTQWYNVSGGKITPQQMFQAFKYGRTAAASWSDEFIGGALGRAIQNLGGGSGGGGGRAGPGNALMSAYAELHDSNAKTVAKRFAGTGLFHNQRVSGTELFDKDPYEWVQQILMPALKAQGITDPNAIREAITKMFPNRTSGQILSEFATQGRFIGGAESLYEKDIRQRKQALDIDSSFDALMAGDWQTNVTAFKRQWKSLMETLGAPIVKDATGYLKDLTDTITKLVDVAKNNPEAVKILAAGIAALGAVLIGAAGIAVLGFIGAGGWLVVGVTALGTAIVLYGDKIKTFLGGFGDWIKNFFGKIGGGYNPQDFNGFQYQSYYGPGIKGHTTNASLGGGNDYGEVTSSPSYGGIASSPSGRGIASSPLGGNGVGANAGANPMGGAIPSYSSNPNVDAAIAAAAKATGMDFAHVKAMASIESSLNPGSNRNRATQYKGLFQIGRSEWREFLAHGGHGDIYNPMDNAMAMAYLANRNAADFHRRFGRNPTADEIYLMHQQGLGFYTRGAMTNIGGNPYPGMRGAQSHSSFEAGWSREVERRASKFALTARPPDAYAMGNHPAYHAMQWHHNFSSGHSAVPQSNGGEIHVHHTTRLDGRVIAQNTMKHMVRHGNQQTVGTRLADYAITRPMPV